MTRLIHSISRRYGEWDIALKCNGMTKTQFDFIFVMREKGFRFRNSFSIVNENKCVYHIEVKRKRHNMEYICRVWGKQIKIIGWFLEMEKKKKSPEETEVQYGADGCYRIFSG